MKSIRSAAIHARKWKTERQICKRRRHDGNSPIQRKTVTTRNALALEARRKANRRFRGGGSTSTLYKPCFEAEGIDPVYFIDNDPAKQGTLFQGKPIISLEQARKDCKGYLILISSQNYYTCKSILHDLQASPIENTVVMNVDEFVFRRHADEILKIFDWLEDDFSKQTYANIVLARMAQEEQSAELVVGDQYFGVPAFTRRNPDEVFVDCGAYVGDTVEQYLWAKEGMFGKIYAFEPAPRNFAAAQTRIRRLEQEWAISAERIHLEEAGIGQESGELLLYGAYEETAALGAGFINSSCAGSEKTVPVFSLDQYFAVQKISFLKADIEGFEFSLIRGAQQVIRRDTPNIAICIYHHPTDMYRLAVELKRLVPEYHMAVRQHYYDLNGINETVLYAWK